MSGTDAFLATIKEHPSNNGPRLVYADWLEEHGACDRAELIRLHCAGQHQDRITALIEKHGRSWAAEDLGIPESCIPKGATLEFHKGFIFFPVIIRPFAALMADGKYGHENSCITLENFPFTAEEGDTAQLVLVHFFGRSISTEDATSGMAQMALDPAKIEHLMAYGAQHWKGNPELIAALGSSWVYPLAHRVVPFLGEGSWRRFLGLDCSEDEWVAPCRFAAVRKVPNPAL